MTNHPNRSRVKTAASSPSPAAVLAARQQAQHTQAQSAAVIYRAERSWREWELGGRNMPASDFELYKHKAGLEQIPFVAR